MPTYLHVCIFDLMLCDMEQLVFLLCMFVPLNHEIVSACLMYNYVGRSFFVIIIQLSYTSIYL